MLQLYVSDTLDYFDTVTDFCNANSRWMLQRETELELMKDIKERASRLNLGFLQVFKSKEKRKEFGEYLRTKSTGNKSEELEKDLATVLKNTLEGVEKLTCFLDALEKLAVTSLQVFTGGEEVMKLSLGFSLESLEDIILAARLVCPRLLHFKRDAEVFFTPSLHNVAIFEAELDKYIRTTENICKTMDASFTVGFGHKRRRQPLVEFAEDLTEEDLQNTLAHVKALSSLRRDQDFRLVFLFQDKSVSGFVNQFSECLPRMLEFLDEMEGCAVQLDRMKKGSKISRVTGSSVGVLGGVMTLAGLALAPVTAGLSLGLTVGGVGLGITSGVNYAVTTVTEIAVNEVQKKRANGGLQCFMEDVERIQACLDEVINQREETLGKDHLDSAKGAAGVVSAVSGIGFSARSIHKARLAARIPGIAEQAAKGTRAVTQMAVGIGLNVLFIGLDIYTICTESISLSRGGQTKASEFIRARAVLLRSEVDCWTRIHDSVGTGMKQFESRENVLQSSFRNQL
ncbi:uncharacterized protein LOC130405165 [Gadus chalcogrammus]|uniref:uncharacterized protein LOC130405165 n=1 Tax=Gadus chalcogrammus TaxID=1042646 RepID=UPI0024C45C06|nr:uncharacterized protein LOC130405165 [Gadus chalcogrammus]XP_056466153.1 uncharacterized protein LOC130405165 [Gadus chalcogrammus]XP_056466163.1 uncharacterized protein LOC130405165 [Gadus chalcogrammus]XP_056466172.1 uncharacterized protein LOC130405165 [Gadus chalcogrammus]